MRIRHKIFVGYMALIAVSVVLVVIFLITLSNINKSYDDLLNQVDWDKYGVVDGVAKDPRCENCMVHCGYEPSAMLGRDAKSGDTWKNLVFNFAAKPVPSGAGHHVRAFDGVTVGNGHLTGKKEEVPVEVA